MWLSRILTTSHVTQRMRNGHFGLLNGVNSISVGQYVTKDSPHLFRKAVDEHFQNKNCDPCSGLWSYVFLLFCFFSVNKGLSVVFYFKTHQNAFGGRALRTCWGAFSGLWETLTGKDKWKEREERWRMKGGERGGKWKDEPPLQNPAQSPYD